MSAPSSACRRFGEIQEEDVVGAGDPPFCREDLAHLGQLPADLREGENDLEFWKFAQPGEKPRPPERCPDDDAAEPAPGAGFRHQPGHLRLRFGFRPAELAVRGKRGVFQPEVVGQDTQDMGGVVPPPRHADVDFRDGPVPEPLQERGQAGLRHGGQFAGTEPLGQQRGRLPGQQPEGFVVGTDGGGKPPQLQIHLRGDVVGQSAQNGLELGPGIAPAPFRSWTPFLSLPPTAPEQLSGEGQHRKAESRKRDDGGDIGKQPGEYPFGVVQPLPWRSTPGQLERLVEILGEPVHAAERGVRPEQRP